MTSPSGNLTNSGETGLVGASREVTRVDLRGGFASVGRVASGGFAPVTFGLDPFEHPSGLGAVIAPATAFLSDSNLDTALSAEVGGLCCALPRPN